MFWTITSDSLKILLAGYLRTASVRGWTKTKDQTQASNTCDEAQWSISLVLIFFLLFFFRFFNSFRNLHFLYRAWNTLFCSAHKLIIFIPLDFSLTNVTSVVLSYFFNQSYTPTTPHLLNLCFISSLICNFTYIHI